MIYTNLLSFLVVIFVLSIAEAPVRPLLAPQLGLPLFALILFAYYRLAGREHRNMLHWGGATRYFSAEKKLTLLAVLFFAFSVFSFDLKYYLEPLSLGGRLPVLTDSGGLLLFFLFLILMWLQARTNYLTLFGGKYSPASFASLNLRASLPIILPWLLLSLSFDLLLLLPFPSLHRFLDSAWGNLLIILPALLLALVFLPALVWRLWNCSPLPPGPQRSMIEKFCRRQNFSASILRWPLYEGRMLTAAVMGLAPRLRYLLLTPALLNLLDKEELESVLAHEIGHIRHRHLLLYLFLLLGFSVLAETLAQQLLVLFFSSSWFWRFALWSKVAAERLAESLTGAALLLLLALFFRFLFGWFIRNFERQADLHAFRAQQSSQPLIRAFEKIAAMSGNIREQKNWHHFGIGERIDFLARCEHRPVLTRQHDRKVRLALAAYFLLIGLTVWLAPAPDRDIVNRRTRAAQLEALLHHAPEGSSHDQQEIRNILNAAQSCAMLRKLDKRESRTSQLEEPCAVFMNGLWLHWTEPLPSLPRTAARL